MRCLCVENEQKKLFDFVAYTGQIVSLDINYKH